MRKNLLLILAVTSVCFSLLAFQPLQEKDLRQQDNSVTHILMSILQNDYPAMTSAPLSEIREMLHREAKTLNMTVIEKVIKTIKCADQYKVEHNNILTVIDYSIPSSEKRLWVFDLKEKKLLFHTYVSHGITSGALLSTFFSNKYNSKASSIGVYKTDKTYYGREGLALRLDGLDASFNDNASNRSVVMHSGWYVEEDFIKKYGRAGRSWGCPALPLNVANSIINTIKDNSLFVIYYPSDHWFLKSKFLNCDTGSSPQNIAKQEMAAKPENDMREDVLFANVNNKRHEDDPIVVMSADNYARVFNTKAPLARMLRRQINKEEYIALSNEEFKSIATNSNKLVNIANKDSLSAIYFVIPVIKMVRGYYETEMKIVNYGKITDIKFNTNSSPTSYTVYFDAKPSIHLRASNQFIRWLGL